MKKITTTRAIFCNLFIGIMTFGSWFFMAVLGGDGESLTANGLGSLKFYTVLSNIFNGAVCLFYAYWLWKGKEITVFKKLLKLTATTVVGVTFTVVMTFLAPLYGFVEMHQGANLWLHLILPVTSFVTFIFFERGVTIPFKKTLWVIVPTILYEIGYLTNIFLHGIGTWPETNDFYGFLNWGYGVGAIIAVAIVLLTWGISLILRKLGKAN